MTYMHVHASILLNIHAFLMCPKLKPYRQQLTTRLSRTLINRRLFVHRQRRKGILLPKAQPLSNAVKATKKDLSGLIYCLQINSF